MDISATVYGRAQDYEVRNHNPLPPIREHNREPTSREHEPVVQVILPCSSVPILKPDVEILENADGRHPKF